MKRMVMLFLVTGLSMAHAQIQNNNPPLYACKKIDRNIKLDGALDDELWQKAETVYMKESKSGKPGTFETRVRLLYNSEYLYVGFECEDDFVWGTLKRRDDPIYDEECVEVFLNPANSGYCYYELNLSPKNIIYDAFVLTARTEQNADAKIMPLVDYDMEGLLTRTRINGEVDQVGKSKGWMAEYAIPFSECLGATNRPPQPGDRWRINFYRIDSVAKGKPTLYAWNPTGYLKFHIPWRFGVLQFE